jgi:iron(III) transport system substrate-binding protein
MRQFYVMPVRDDVPPPEGARPLSEVKLISATPQEIEQGLPEVKELWRDTFGV